MKALIYCVKSKPYLVKDYDLFEEFVGFKTTNDLTNSKSLNGLSKALNGKIVAEVEIDEVDQIWYMSYEEDNRYDCLFSTEEELCLKSCLDHYELHNYLKGNKGYALHLTNLKVFDRPLSFDKDYIYKDYKTNALITKAPQNMCYCYDRFGNKYVLISIQPQHLCKILNGEKTIEVRRKVLNCLKEMKDDE